MDGVLIDSEPIHFSAIETVLKKYGVNIAKDGLDRFVGDTNERVWTIFKKDFNLPEPIDFYIEQQLESTITLLKQGDFQPIKGVLELLGMLQCEGFTIGLASSSPPQIITTILEVIGVAPFITKWVSGNEVVESKPKPFIYLRAAQLLGYEPGQCVAVEDSFYGVTAAKAAGMFCIGYLSPDAIKQDLSAADLIVHSMSDINSSTFDMFRK